jgi:hypothetical protein
MLRLVRFVLLLAIATFVNTLIATESGLADDKELILWPVKWTVTNPDSVCADTLKGDTFPTMLLNGASIWVNARNGYVAKNTKLAICDFLGENIDLTKLSFVEGRGYYPGGTTKPGVLLDEENIENAQGDPIGVRFLVKFQPQPCSESIKIQANADITIQKVIIKTTCFVPALTNWGLIILLALLILSGIIVIRQRRRGVVRA